MAFLEGAVSGQQEGAGAFLERVAQRESLSDCWSSVGDAKKEKDEGRRRLLFWVKFLTKTSMKRAVSCFRTLTRAPVSVKRLKHARNRLKTTKNVNPITAGSHEKREVIPNIFPT